MRYFITLIATFALSLLANSVAQAADYEFSSTLNTANVKIASISVIAGEKLLAEDEVYGPRDIEEIKKYIKKHVTARLEKSDMISETGVHLELTIADMTPNRPTVYALSRQIGLDYHRSISVGGAEIDARFIMADGKDIGNVHYRWYAGNLDETALGATTWSDARLAVSKFSRRIVKILKNAQLS